MAYPCEAAFRQHGSMPPGNDKAAARRRLRGARAARSDAQRAAAGRALAARVIELVDIEGAGPRADITAYLALPTEPSLDEAIEALRARGHRVWVPRILPTSLEWVALEDGQRTRLGPLGIRQPDGPAVSTESLAAVRLVLLPGLAADRDGHRLGQGGGYYDRFLATLAPAAVGGPLRAVVLFDDEVISSVPTEVHDQRVDVIVTPGRIVRTTSATS